MVSRRCFLWVLLFSVLIVWSHWNLSSKGAIALGINFSMFWVGFAAIVYSFDSSYRFKRDWVWLVPIALIVLSYSLYENPWLKLVSLYLLPILIGIFCAYSHFLNSNELLWNSTFFRAICKRFFKPLSATGKPFEGMHDQADGESNDSVTNLITRVLTGIIILLPLSFLVLQLLSSADAEFGKLVDKSLRLIVDIVSWQLVWKLMISVMLAITLISIAVGWTGTIDYTKSAGTKPIDGLVASIVLGGLLVIYVAFLSLQIGTLVIEELPEDFRTAELMVKSGFWQLFLLAMLNTALFCIVYRKTDLISQWVLRVFIIASSLLMVSAAWKVFLYSYTFGLSYEKFFACYTAVFALGVLLYLVAASFSIQRRNVIKTIAFAALWSYAVATVSPVEKIIFQANVHFSEQENTRITLVQLSQLSLDVMGDVDSVYSQMLAENTKTMNTWAQWRFKQNTVICTRPWYETNLSALKVCL